MEEDYKKAIKCMVFAQSFVESMDDFEGTTAFKHQIKVRGNAFIKEVDKFLDSVYKEGSTETQMIELIEACQKAIDKVIDEDVVITD